MTPELKDLIEREIDQYLEWPTADKSHVTTVSAKLFAEHVARLYAEQQPEPDGAQLVEALEIIAESCDVGRHDGLSEEGPGLCATESWLIAKDAMAAYRKQGGGK